MPASASLDLVVAIVRLWFLLTPARTTALAMVAAARRMEHLDVPATVAILVRPVHSIRTTAPGTAEATVNACRAVLVLASLGSLGPTARPLLPTVWPRTIAQPMVSAKMERADAARDSVVMTAVKHVTLVA